MDLLIQQISIKYLPGVKHYDRSWDFVWRRLINSLLSWKPLGALEKYQEEMVIIYLAIESVITITIIIISYR